HPGLQIALRHAPAAEVAALVAAGDADVGVAGLYGDPPAGLVAEALADEQIHAMLPEDDSRAGRPVELAALAERPFILAERGSGLREAVLAACQRAGFSPIPLFEISDPLTVRHLVQAGLGVGVAPAAWFESPGPPVAASPLAGEDLRHRVGAITSAAGPPPAAELLLAALRDAFERPV
ncbi:MAG: hypothetical protein QOK21_3903, partial [Solirubrobacteraceae bacterium]|nr:hypothetical protein [Solirubrobacteraceae bacterium]